jgi:hypothetical protein
MSPEPIQEGRTYEVPYPFVHGTYEEQDFDGETVSTTTLPTWMPGINSEMVSPDDSEAVADGMGKMLLTVVSVHHLPRPYPTRVFFVREWIDPDGKRFGKKKLHIMTLAAFRRRLSGFWVEFRMRQQSAAA